MRLNIYKNVRTEKQFSLDLSQKLSNLTHSYHKISQILTSYMETSDHSLLCVCVCVCFTTQIFDDAYKSQLSCVVVDDIERLLGESHTHSVSVFVLWFSLR